MKRNFVELFLKNFSPPLEEKQKQKEIAARKLAKQEIAGVSVKNIVETSRVRSTRKLVNYAYEEEYFFEEWE